MWNAEAYQIAIKAAKMAGSLQGVEVKSQEDIYAIMAKKGLAGRETAISWARKGSTGPGDNDLIEEVEKLFGLDTGALGKREEKPIKKSGKKSKGVEATAAAEAVKEVEVVR